MLRITWSLLHRSRCSARLRGRGAAGGSLSISMLSRRLTVAPFLQPALSASSAVWPAASSHQQSFLFSLRLSRNATGFDHDDAAGLDAFDCHRRMQAPHTLLQMHPSARPVYPRAWKPRSTCSNSRACHRACHPLAFCACLSAAPGCAERPLTPAQTAPVCLRCPTSCASARLS